MKKVISTDQAPGAIGPYSQAVIAESVGLLYTAGQLGITPGSGEFVPGGVQEQTQQALLNIQAILEEAGSGLDSVLKTTVFLDNMDNFAAMNEVYATFFTENPPARSAVEVSKLPKGGLVEIEAVAIIG